MAEVAAGAIAMRLGGYMAGRTDIEHFASERAREEREVAEVPHREVAEVTDILRSYGLDEEDATRVVKSIKADKKRWVDFMMRFELGLEEPDPTRAGRSALTISLAYIAGGLIPLLPSLTPTDFSPVFTPEKAIQPRVFELRTYTCPSAEKLTHLHERFRSHTLQLFAKHGMENLI